MPTESTFLLAGLFFFAAALGYFFARFGNEEIPEESGSKGRLNADYIKGLNFLLNEKPDQALEVFMRMVEVDDETLETHFALGSLFRRRGEVDRAIRVHQNIIARPNLGDMHREQALVSLAEDYLSAGLFDRAEKLFQDLRKSEENHVFALRKLLRIFEATHEWENAIDAYQELEKLDEEAGEANRVAHYYCELAESCIVEKDFARAREFLHKAAKDHRPTVRSRLLLGDLYSAANDHRRAITAYKKAVDGDLRLTGEVVPRLANSCRAIDDQASLSKILNDWRKTDKSIARAIGLATVYDKRIVNEVALECLREFVTSDPIFSRLVDESVLQDADKATRDAALERIRDALGSVVRQSHRYRCAECGYSTSKLQWNCPNCRAWETFSPSVTLNFPAFGAAD